MEYIESPHFTKLIDEYLTVEEYTALQWFLALQPEAGDRIPHTGGLRKVRWGGHGHGKRSGLRVIYYYKAEHDQIWLLTVYAKNEEQNIPSHVLQKLKKELIQ